MRLRKVDFEVVVRQAGRFEMLDPFHAAGRQIGRGAQAGGLGPQDGITVLPRVHVEYATVATNLAEVIEEFLANGADRAELEEACRRTASRTAWSGGLERDPDRLFKDMRATSLSPAAEAGFRSRKPSEGARVREDPTEPESRVETGPPPARHIEGD